MAMQMWVWTSYRLPMIMYMGGFIWPSATPVLSAMYSSVQGMGVPLAPNAL